MRVRGGCGAMAGIFNRLGGIVSDVMSSTGTENGENFLGMRNKFDPFGRLRTGSSNELKLLPVAVMGLG